MHHLWYIGRTVYYRSPPLYVHAGDRRFADLAKRMYREVCIKRGWYLTRHMLLTPEAMCPASPTIRG